MINALTDDQAGAILKAIYKYTVNGIEPVFKDETLSMFWISIEKWFREDAATYKKLKNNSVLRR